MNWIRLAIAGCTALALGACGATVAPTDGSLDAPTADAAASPDGGAACNALSLTTAPTASRESEVVVPPPIPGRDALVEGTYLLGLAVLHGPSADADAITVRRAVLEVGHDSWQMATMYADQTEVRQTFAPAFAGTTVTLTQRCPEPARVLQMEYSASIYQIVLYIRLNATDTLLLAFRPQ